MNIIDPSAAGTEQLIMKREHKEEAARNREKNASAAKRALLLYAGISLITVVFFVVMVRVNSLVSDKFRFSAASRYIMAVGLILPGLGAAIANVFALRFSLRSGRWHLVILSSAAGFISLAYLGWSVLMSTWPS